MFKLPKDAYAGKRNVQEAQGESFGQVSCGQLPIWVWFLFVDGAPFRLVSCNRKANQNPF